MHRSRKMALRLAMGLVVLGVVISWQPLGAYLALWREVTLWPVALAYCLTAPMVLLRARQTQYLASLQGMRVGFGPLVGLQLATTFYGLFAPGIVAMGVLRWYRLARLGGDPKATLALVVFSRMVEIEMALLLGFLFWVADPDAPGGLGLPLSFAGLLLAIVTFRWLAFGAQTGPLASRLMQYVLPARLCARAQARLAELLEIAGRYGALTPRAWATLLLNIVTGHALGLLTVGLIALALGMDVGWATLGWVRAVLALALLLPITWAGIGLREATLAAALVAAGQPAAAAIALGLLLELRMLLEAALGGLVELRPVHLEPEHHRGALT